MKTFRMFAAMTAIVMGAMTMSANNSRTNSRTSTEHENGLVTYNYGNIKMIYAINDEGLVTSKTSYRLNPKNGEWTPDYVYKATYTGDNSTLSYSRWNKLTHKFNRDKQSQQMDEETLKLMMTLPAAK